jgi:hypothetical protein
VDSFTSLDDFAAMLEKNCKLQDESAGSMSIDYTSITGKKIYMEYRHDSGRAYVEIDRKTVDYKNWPIYESKYVCQKDGVLSVNDGRDGFAMDFSGDMPVYRNWNTH